jgi:hypothetical protein
MNRTKQTVLAWVDGTRPTEPPPPRTLQAAEAHAHVAALVKQAYQQPLPEHTLAFMAERVLARATTEPPREWYQRWLVAVLRPTPVLAAVAVLLAVIAALQYAPVRQLLQRHSTRAFVIYRAQDGTPIYQPIEYQRVTQPEDEHGST